MPEEKPDVTVTDQPSAKTAEKVDAIAFLSDENLDRMQEATDGGAEQVAGGRVDGDPGRESAGAEDAPSPDASPAGTGGSHEVEAPSAGAAEPGPVDWKTRYDELQGRYSGAMKELNRRWAEEKAKPPAPPQAAADPVREKFEAQRRMLAKQKEFVESRLAEARKAFPDKDPEDQAAYAEYWGEKDFNDWDAERKYNELRQRDPHYQRIVRQELNERQRRLEQVVREAISPVIGKNPELKSTFADALRRNALRLEQVEGTPGRYVNPDGSFSQAFHEHEQVVELVTESADVAVGRVERSKVVRSVEEAYKQGQTDAQAAARKKRARTLVPIGTGRGARPTGGRSATDDVDDIVRGIVNARR
jgi:hypothetical protein